MYNIRKTTQDALQEEILRERLSVLVRAGGNLANAWDRLEKLKGEMEAEAREQGCMDGPGGPAAPDRRDQAGRGGISVLNRKIREYNEQIERVRTLLYYMIVTREALGLIHHQRLEEMY
ncbi:MAG: hypothetical protein AB1558_11560 [Thermodesulfobacteriota bacterium]